jgi:hypothetical protein
MNFENPLVLLIIGLVAAMVGYVVITHLFSEEAKQERRRRRSNARLTSKAKRPMVKFSVRTKKTKD